MSQEAGASSRGDAGRGALPTLAVIIPVKNEAAIIDRSVQSVIDTIDPRQIALRVVCVDDGSTDQTWERLTDLARRFPQVMAVRLSRNFGHDAALLAGIETIDADAIITIDADGQHPFSEIPRMVEIWRKTGCNVVNGVKRRRGSESHRYAISTALFGRILSQALQQDLANATEYKLLDRTAVKALLRCGDRIVLFRALAAWIGLHQETLLFDVAPSLRGHSHWRLKGLIAFAVNGIVAFSELPIVILFGLGALAILGSLLLFAKLLFGLVYGSVAEGYSTIVVLLLLNLGFMMIAMGIIGLYVRMTLVQTLARPRSIIKEIRGGQPVELRSTNVASST